MNCTHCGAPMTLFRDRDYYYCDHCQSYHFPEKNNDGLRVLGENPEKLKCSHCKVVMSLITYEDFFQGYQCPKCQGILFNRTTFREAIDYSRSRTLKPPEPLGKFDQNELKRVSYCSKCGQKMETFQYNGPGNIVIDTCHDCDLIWLDYGELGKVVNAPGRDRGVPRKPPKKEESQDRAKSGTIDELLLEIAKQLFNKN